MGISILKSAMEYVVEIVTQFCKVTGQRYKLKAKYFWHISLLEHSNILKKHLYTQYHN